MSCVLEMHITEYLLLFFSYISDPTSKNGALSKVFYEMELNRYHGEDPPPLEADCKSELFSLKSIQ